MSDLTDDRLTRRYNALVGALDDRFWGKVDTTGDCHLWLSTLHPDGYGQFFVNGASTGAHRVAYQLSVGPIPPGFEVDHVCRNRRCVNPDHLRLATRSQNMQNQEARGRPWCGKATASGSIRGVSRAPSGRWRARVTRDGATRHIGVFDTIEEAAMAATRARNEMFTHNNADRTRGAE